MFDKIISTSTLKESWDIFKVVYQGNDTVKTVKLQTLQAHFETPKMTHTDNVDEFMTRVIGIVGKIKLIVETITDQSIVEKFL